MKAMWLAVDGLLLVAAGWLTVISLHAWRAPASGAEVPRVVVAPAPAAAPAPLAVPVLGRLDDQRAAGIWEDNLFHPTRQASATDGVVAAVAAAPVTPADLGYDLLGIAQVGEQTVATLVRRGPGTAPTAATGAGQPAAAGSAASSPHLVVSVGSEVAQGFTVTQIGTDRIVLQRLQESVALELNPRAKGPARPHAAAVSTGMPGSPAGPAGGTIRVLPNLPTRPSAPASGAGAWPASVAVPVGNVVVPTATLSTPAQTSPQSTAPSGAVLPPPAPGQDGAASGQRVPPGATAPLPTVPPTPRH